MFRELVNTLTEYINNGYEQCDTAESIAYHQAWSTGYIDATFDTITRELEHARESMLEIVSHFGGLE